MFKNIKAEKYLKMVNNYLEEAVSKIKIKRLKDSVEYSLLSGGKRIRSILTLEFCSVCSGDISKALPFACAIEMIHTYSLIHDDLPCMDDDDMRRGKPANHIKFGEDIAVLTGDLLLNLAFETILNEADFNTVGYNNVLKALKNLASASGAKGMIGGQCMDLGFEDINANKLSVDRISDMYKKKTGALIVASCKIGCIIAGADDKKISEAKNYGESLGLAFQITDDILDITSESVILGKPVKSDIKNNKATLVSVLGLEESESLASDLTKKAISSLDVFKEDTSFLRELALYAKNRKS